MSATSKLKIVNRGRDIITLELPIFEADGKTIARTANGRIKREQIVIGSVDDHLVVGCVQPEIEIERAKWNRLLEQKAVAGLVKDRKLAVYAAA